MVGAFIADRFFRRLDGLGSGTLRLTTPDGVVRTFAGCEPGPDATLTLHNWHVIASLMYRGDVGLAEAYRAGHWETEDLIALTALGLMNRFKLGQVMVGTLLWRGLFMLSYLFRLNSATKSRRNIQAHYDLGNAFYRLWLDPSMTYSSAIFAHPQQTLEEAQCNKYDRILEYLGRTSGKLLEIGCGWGGFIAQAQKKADFAIKGITLSEEQASYARTHVMPQAAIDLEDYRHVTGRFDSIVSIEMFEAVGERYWPVYFRKVKDLLATGGKLSFRLSQSMIVTFHRIVVGAISYAAMSFPVGCFPVRCVFGKKRNGRVYAWEKVMPLDRITRALLSNGCSVSRVAQGRSRHLGLMMASFVFGVFTLLPVSQLFKQDTQMSCRWISRTLKRLFSLAFWNLCVVLLAGLTTSYAADRTFGVCAGCP